MRVMLNVKTSYSLLSSLINIDDLLLFAKDNNLNTLSIVDNNMSSFMEFYNKCNLHNIKPVFGLNTFIENYNIVLFPKNYDGYLNLLKINSHIIEEQFNKDILNKYKENIIIVSLSKDLKIDHADLYYGVASTNKKFVFFNEVAYLEKEHKKAYSHLLALSDKTNTEDKHYIKNNYEFFTTKEALFNAEEILDSVNIVIKKQKINLPKYLSDVSSDEYLYSLSTKGLSKRLNNEVSKKYEQRLKEELEVIMSLNYSDYFLIVYDFIKYAKQKNILVGPGRGSSAGSLVAYSLGITDVDPIKYDLLFERFLNKDRNTMPDIDVDFPDNKREEVISYVEEKYGINNVSRIITFNTFGYKNAFRELKDVLNIPEYKIEDLFRITRGSNKTLKEIYKENNRFKIMINEDIKLKELYNSSLLIEKLPRSISKHPAGVIISKNNLNNYVPLIKVNEQYLSGYSMNYLEDLGLLKMDFLGLKNLTWIDNLIEEINKEENQNIKFSTIPLEGEKTNELFSNGLTDGIFQFESFGMKNMLKKVKPNSFKEIYTSTALYRPGAINEIDNYILGKKDQNNIKYIHDSLSDILNETYGVIVFQEQIMKILQTVSNYNLKESDNIRRAISKKDVKIIEDLKEDFIKRGSDNKYDLNTLNNIYEKLVQFASYGFPKAHAVSYGIISYKMSYLKAHYPMYFYKMLLNSVIGNTKKTYSYILEAKKFGVEIQRPNINISTNVYEIHDNKLYYPLTNLKNVNNMSAEEIMKYQYTNLDVFELVKLVDNKLLTKDILYSLIITSTVKSNKYNTKTLIENLDIILNYGEVSKNLGDVLIPVLNKHDQYLDLELTNLEKDIFGFYFNNHPALIYKYEHRNVLDISDIKKHFNKRINFIGIVTNVHKIITKNNEEMAFVKLEDETGFVDCVLFPKTFNKYNEIKVNDLIKVFGLVERREDKYQLIINSIEQF